MPLPPEDVCEVCFFARRHLPGIPEDLPHPQDRPKPGAMDLCLSFLLTKQIGLLLQNCCWWSFNLTILRQAARWEVFGQRWCLNVWL